MALDTDAEAKALVRRLRGEGYAVIAVVEQEADERIATVRLTSARTGSEGAVLDLLFASSGIEREIVDAAAVVDLFEGLAVPLASLPALVAQKVLARDDVRRPKDRLDLVKLLEVASDPDLLEAERLLGLITVRAAARLSTPAYTGPVNRSRGSGKVEVLIGLAVGAVFLAIMYALTREARFIGGPRLAALVPAAWFWLLAIINLR